MLLFKIKLKKTFKATYLFVKWESYLATLLSKELHDNGNVLYHIATSKLPKNIVPFFNFICTATMCSSSRSSSCAGPADPGQRLHRLSRRPKCTQNINVLS